MIAETTCGGAAAVNGAGLVNVPALISAAEGQRLLGCSKPTWYRLASRPDFPRRVRLGKRRGVRWSRAKVLAWVEAREGRR